MTGVLRRFVGVFLLAGGLVLLAILGTRGGIVSSGFTSPPVFSVNRIAVVGSDGHIRSYKPDGSDERRVSSGDGFFTWPTWAPSGRSMVFSGVVPGAGGRPTVTLFEYNGVTRLSHTLHRGVPGFAGLLANGVVHYPLWSPDSTKLAFIVATESGGLTLYLDRVTGNTAPESVLTRGPLWMSWSADSTRLLVHRGSEHFLVDARDELLVQRIDISSASYRVPAWRPSNNDLTILHNEGGPLFGLYSAQITPDGLVLGDPISIGGPDAAFLWSRGGDHIAIADDAGRLRYGQNVMFVYRQLRILEPGSHEPIASVRGNLMAYFWSPDGSKIAYVTLLDQQGLMRWTVLNVVTGETTDLVDFVPSSDQLTMFQFFDQYAYSHHLWSPDSRYLVFAGRVRSSATTVGFNPQLQDQGSRVFIVDTGLVITVEPVAEGTLALWSPT